MREAFISDIEHHLNEVKLKSQMTHYQQLLDVTNEFASSRMPTNYLLADLKMWLRIGRPFCWTRCRRSFSLTDRSVHVYMHVCTRTIRTLHPVYAMVTMLMMFWARRKSINSKL